MILRGLYFPDELGIELVTGPTPLEAIKQLTRRTSTSASLLQKQQHGLHICPEVQNRETARTDALNSLKDSIATMETLNAPWDTHCLYRGLSPAIEHDAEDRNSMLDLVKEARKLLGDAGKSLVAHLTPMVSVCVRNNEGGWGGRGEGVGNERLERLEFSSAFCIKFVRVRGVLRGVKLSQLQLPDLIS